MFSFDLLANAVVAGILLGGFYAAVSLGISVSFGLLDVANIAHPVFIIAGAYAVYAVNTAFALDPILAGLLFTPLFYVLVRGYVHGRAQAPVPASGQPVDTPDDIKPLYPWRPSLLAGDEGSTHA